MELDLRRLNLALANRCWAMTDLIKAAKLGSNTLYKIIHKKSKPNARTVGKIAKALEVDVTEIIKEDS